MAVESRRETGLRSTSETDQRGIGRSGEGGSPTTTLGVGRQFTLNYERQRTMKNASVHAVLGVEASSRPAWLRMSSTGRFGQEWATGHCSRTA
jgi:hypothetical protein